MIRNITRTLLGSLLLFCGIAQGADKPNVVLMLADNLGYGDLSVYNGGTRGDMRTPNIDKLASEGMLFTQFLVEPGCTPSRAGLLTGQYSIRSGMSLIITAGAAGGLQKDDFTLGSMFQSAGYDTAYMGKWHLGPQTQSQPQNQGFDSWTVGFKGTTDGVLWAEAASDSGMPEALQEAVEIEILEAKGKGEAKKVGVYDREYRQHIEADIAKAASKYIKQQAKKQDPFFLMLGWTRPHFPNDAAPEFQGKSGAGPYGDSIVELDARTGEVLDAIESAGIADNTIVIWLSDNGATVTGTVPAEVGGGSNGPFRGELGDGYEGSIRTAGMIRWPGKIKPGASNEMISVHDFLPTLANIAGTKLPRGRPYDGFDQTDFLLGKQEQSNREHLITFVGDRIIAVRWKQFRIYPLEFISSGTNPVYEAGYLSATKETAGFPRIYNIDADPREIQDLAVSGYAWVLGKYAEIIGEYKGTLKKYPNPPAPNLTNF
jgi:arylsulfatase